MDLKTADRFDIPHARPHHRGAAWFLAAALLLPVSAPAAPQEAPEASGEVINRVILRVNGRILTLYNYLERRAEARQDIALAKISEEDRERLLSELPRRVMSGLFQEMLLLSRADQLEVFVTDDSIREEIDRRNQAIGFRTEEEFVKALQDSGITLESYKKQVETRMIMNEVIGREVQSRVRLDDDALRRYYRENPDEFITPERRQTREVVVLDSSGLSPEEMTSLGREIFDKLADGNDLESVAEEYSADGRSSGVIDLEWVERGDLDSALEAVLWALSPGEFSEPVVARGGLHILQLLEIEEPAKMAFNDVRESIYNREAGRLFDEGLNKYFDELSLTAYIVENLPEDAVGYRKASSKPFVDEPFKIRGESEDQESEPTLELDSGIR